MTPHSFMTHVNMMLLFHQVRMSRQVLWHLLCRKWIFQPEAGKAGKPVRTTSAHSSARIESISPQIINEKFAQGMKVAVVAGFKELAIDPLQPWVEGV